MKTATSIEEQIELLQSRGMKVADKEKAKEVLLDIGYYRLGFYWFPYEESYPSRKHRTHKYKANTSFEQVLTLYYFDYDLRNLIVKYLYRIEVNFRTFVIYTVSNHYKNNPTWFADPRIMQNDFIKDFPERYKTIRRNEVIKYHHAKYINDIYAPAWKTLEYMTFGDILYLYSSLKDEELQKEIAEHYNIRNVNVFINYMGTLRVIRNLCAHGHNIFDLKLQKRISKGPITELMDNRFHSLVGGLLVLTYILSSISKNRVQELHYNLHLLVTQKKIEKIEDIIKDLKDFVVNRINSNGEGKEEV